MKWPCLAVKACQQYKYLIVLYIEKLLKQGKLCYNINYDSITEMMMEI